MTQLDKIHSGPIPIKKYSGTFVIRSTFLSISVGEGKLPSNPKVKRGVVGAVRDLWGGSCVHFSNFGPKWELDEYKIAKAAMLAPDDVRIPVNIFSTANKLALQAVPKYADGQPARTGYLWYIESARANATIANVVERLDREKEQARSILDKLARLMETKVGLTRASETI
ncbi:hypothetical protein RSOLAG22IIIB_10761 [Rhizoctonia solani]|uniref:Uncharacterized protein n=1 Tax=Rhizoctonia solani TaxID=456999 RepID=A0A0K6G4E6_9AGAM|nr:hypothetical protein RSOLAG22IIIB_10761 [Rhizoctonia solani]